MKIAVFEIADWEKPTFDRLQGAHTLTMHEGPITEENAAEFADADVVSCFIYSQLNRAAISRLPKLRLIATRSTGYDHIDLAACRERNIVVCNVPSYGENTVAEHAFGLLLTISHKLDQAIDRTRKGDFSTVGLRGFDLFGKTIGIVGTGAIGKCACRIARGFGMTVLAYDVRPDHDFGARMAVRYVDLDTLLRESDIISLHVPSIPATRHMINQAAFEKMKQGVVIINTARGDVMDVQALVRAIAEKKVAAAGLDVLPEEPVIREETELLRSIYQRTHNVHELLADHVLLRLRNVVITPHSAFDTKEALQRILDTTVQSIEAFVAGSPQCVVR